MLCLNERQRDCCHVSMSGESSESVSIALAWSVDGYLSRARAVCVVPCPPRPAVSVFESKS